MPDMLFVANSITRATRRTGPDNREYLVAPGTIIVQGVLGDEFVPAEEFGRHVQAWAGRPLPLLHPRNARNELISANSPELLAAHSVGFLYNPRLDGDRIRGEYWIDIEKARAMGGEALELIDRLEANEQVETSTAYYRQLDPTPGVWDGRQYQGIARNLVPDHIAVLLHQRGNCSCEDGCGLLANAETHTGIMIALFVPADAAQELALSPDSLPAGSEATPANELHVTLAYLGQVTEAETTELELLDLVRSLAASLPVVRAEIGGIGRFVQESDGKQPIWLQVDSPLLMDAQRRVMEWSVGNGAQPSREHGFTPHITLAYVPADAPTALIPPPRREIVFDALSLAWGGRVTRFPLQGEAIASNQQELPMTVEKDKTEQPVEKNEQPDMAAIVANALQTALPTALNTALEPLATRVQTVEALVNDLGGAEQLRETLQLARSHAQAMAANAKREKDTLIAALVGNARCTFSAERLATMDIEDLSNLVQILQPTDYSGRGFAANQVRADEWVDELPA